MAASIHIRNGALIDGTGSTPRPAHDVLLAGDSIVAVGPTGTLADVPADATVIDASGATIMPGLIDAHCHVTFDDVQSNDELFFHRPAATAAMLTLFNLPKLLRAGVTSMFDPDTVAGVGPEVRDVVESGAFAGPRIATGVQAWRWIMSSRFASSAPGASPAPVIPSRETTYRNPLVAAASWATRSSSLVGATRRISPNPSA